METFKKYFLSSVWVILTILIGAILGHYLNLTWIILILNQWHNYCNIAKLANFLQNAC